MEFHLRQREHENDWVRQAGIRATDPYVPICWSTVARPRTARLVARVAELTRDGDRVLSSEDFWRELGEASAGPAVRRRLLDPATVDAVVYKLGTDRFPRSSGEVSSQTFTGYRNVPLVPARHLDRLHDVELAHHVDTLQEVNGRLERAGYQPVELPDWVYWRAGLEGTRADFDDVRDALFARGLPSWPPMPGQPSASDGASRSPGAAFVERLDALGDRRGPDTPGASL